MYRFIHQWYSTKMQDYKKILHFSFSCFFCFWMDRREPDTAFKDRSIFFWWSSFLSMGSYVWDFRHITFTVYEETHSQTRACVFSEFCSLHIDRISRKLDSWTRIQPESNCLQWLSFHTERTYIHRRFRSLCTAWMCFPLLSCP